MTDNRQIIDNKIDQWGLDRGIIQNGNPMGQAIKTLEETTELLDAIQKNDIAAIADAIGDIYVTLRMVAGTCNLSTNECIKGAYNEIKDRKGFLRADGVFVKEAHPGQTYIDFEVMSPVDMTNGRVK